MHIMTIVLRTDTVGLLSMQVYTGTIIWVESQIYIYIVVVCLPRPIEGMR